MNDFYAYLSSLEPIPAHAADRQQVRKCTKAVVKKLRRTKCRPLFRYGLCAAAAALTAAAALAVPVLHSRAQRPNWRTHYQWMTAKPEAEISADAEMLRPIIVTEPQSVTQEDYAVYVTGYASDGFHGMCFFEVHVPADFDWHFPYLADAQAQSVQSLSGQPADAQDGYFFGCALTPTDDPQVFLGEAAFAYDTEQYETQEPALVSFPLALRDEYYDFDDETGVYLSERNPHLIHLNGTVTFSLEQNDMCVAQNSAESGSLRITPFGIYAFSYDNPQQVQWHSAHHMQITMPDGSAPDSGDFLKRARTLLPNAGAESDCYLVLKTAVFRNPVNPEDITVTFD